MALHHYLAIPSQMRQAMTWNNLGVSFEHFELPGKSVLSFRKSAEMGETLAMANLGRKFISSGFVAEAQEQCNSAIEQGQYHKNIGNLV